MTTQRRHTRRTRHNDPTSGFDAYDDARIAELINDETAGRHADLPTPSDPEAHTTSGAQPPRRQTQPDASPTPPTAHTWRIKRLGGQEVKPSDPPNTRAVNSRGVRNWEIRWRADARA
jgi:hypothetical protein